MIQVITDGILPYIKYKFGRISVGRRFSATHYNSQGRPITQETILRAEVDGTKPSFLVGIHSLHDSTVSQSRSRATANNSSSLSTTLAYCLLKLISSHAIVILHAMLFSLLANYVGITSTYLGFCVVLNGVNDLFY